MDKERKRLRQADLALKPWRQWGPYLSERAWGTVREDYSPKGDAWDYLPYGHARSRAFRWSDDGLAGICDDRQLLCLAVAFWNGSDRYGDRYLLKERLFGLTNGKRLFAVMVKLPADRRHAARLAATCRTIRRS